MRIPQIDYTSRDYLTIKDDLIRVVQQRIPAWQANEESDFTLALVEAFAYLGDNLSYYIDRAANESTIQSSTQLQNLINFAELAGYHVSGPAPAYISLTFTNISESAIDLPIGTQVSGPLDTDTFNEIYFETAAPITGLASGATATVAAFEGYVSNTTSDTGLDGNNLPLPVTLGTSEGYANSEFSIPEAGVVDLSVVVYTGQANSFIKWEYVLNLSDYGPSDRVFTTRLNANGTSSVIFGDGINGKIPEAGIPVSAMYRVSYGVYGNLSLDSSALSNLAVTYIPGKTVASSANYATVIAASASTGGTNGDLQAPYYSLRSNIRKALKTKGRAVTLQDYADLAALIPRVGRASATSDIYTQVNVYAQPLNDGSATPGRISSNYPSSLPEDTTVFTPIRSAVKQFLETRSPVNTVVNVQPPTYVPIYLYMTVYILPTYSQSALQLDIGNLMLNSSTGLFSYNGYAFDEDVVQSAIIYEIMRHPGVSNVVINGLGKISTGYINTTISGSSGTTTITVSSATGLVAGQAVYGTGIAPGAKIATGGISGTTITLTASNVGTVSGNGTFITAAPADIAIGPSEIPSLISNNLTIKLSGGIS